MSSKKKKQIDSLEKAMEAVLSPGRFISYEDAWMFVGYVQAVADQITRLIRKEPERAARLFETFIAACHEKAEEIDDSSGGFGDMVETLFGSYVKARQRAKCDPEETVDFLLFWMEDDPYGYCRYLENEVVDVLNQKGLATFTCRIRAKFEAAKSKDETQLSRYHSPGRRWAGALKTLLTGLRDVDAYIALCKETELESKDCRAIAEMYRNDKRFEEALMWVEEGVKLADIRGTFADPSLDTLKRALLADLGRPKDALRSAWNKFRGHPDLIAYEELMAYVPKEEKTTWHQKAMKASEKADISSQIKLWLKKKEMDRLLARLRRAEDKELENLSHYQTEPLAQKLERAHPDLAARVYRALCLRIVNAGKSKYYDEALDNLEKAKKCYAKADLKSDWEAVVADIRQRHHRKYGFMPGFEDIVSGPSRKKEPSFMDRAKARLPKK